MAVISNYKVNDELLEDQVFTLVRVWGSKSIDQWNGVFSYTFGTVEVGVPWTSEDPYPILYQELMRRLTDEGFIPRSDEAGPEKRPAKKRAKK